MNNFKYVWFQIKKMKNEKSHMYSNVNPKIRKKLDRKIKILVI